MSKPTIIEQVDNGRRVTAPLPTTHHATKIVKVTHNGMNNFKNQPWQHVPDQDENKAPAMVAGIPGLLGNSATVRIFPFNPRVECNMPLAEKVTRWSRGMPFREIENHEWIPDCFPATTSYSSTIEGNSDAAYDLEDTDAIDELQARKITRCTTRLYVNDPEPIAYAGETTCMPLERHLFCTNSWKEM